MGKLSINILITTFSTAGVASCYTLFTSGSGLKSPASVTQALNSLTKIKEISLFCGGSLGYITVNKFSITGKIKIFALSCSSVICLYFTKVRMVMERGFYH